MNTNKEIKKVFKELNCHETMFNYSTFMMYKNVDLRDKMIIDSILELNSKRTYESCDLYFYERLKYYNKQAKKNHPQKSGTILAYKLMSTKYKSICTKKYNKFKKELDRIELLVDDLNKNYTLENINKYNIDSFIYEYDEIYHKDEIDKYFREYISFISDMLNNIQLDNENEYYFEPIDY